MYVTVRIQVLMLECVMGRKALSELCSQWIQVSSTGPNYKRKHSALVVERFHYPVVMAFASTARNHSSVGCSVRVVHNGKRGDWHALIDIEVFDRWAWLCKFLLHRLEFDPGIDFVKLL